MHREVLFADPAPLVLAQLAYHMRASTFLLYFNVTILASAHYLCIGFCPLLIAFIDLIIASLPRMKYM